jgi:EAL domain-containing protein (putative c-di-GMP-specific phosphodiesterase class I)
MSEAKLNPAPQAVINVESKSLRVELDGASHLPSLPTILHDVGVLLHTNGYIAIVLVDLEPLNEIEAECGSGVYNQLILRISKEVDSLRRNIVRAGDLLCAVRPYGEQIAMFLEGPRKHSALTPHELEAVADRVFTALSPKIAEQLRPLGGRGRFRLGYSMAMPNPMIQTERLIYRALDEARVMAEDYSRRTNARGRERLRDLIVNRQLSTVFQPIIDLANGQTTHVQAYEALIRGPVGSDLSSPAMLFNLASHSELVAELDHACLDSALHSLQTMPKDALLFANVLPARINDPQFRNRIGDPAQVGIDPKRIVLELNEGQAIRSYEILSRGIEELRSKGVRVALDDLGAGYANLDHVLKLRPDFLKLDISLIRGVHQSPVKQALIGSMVQVGRAVGATVIAEGVEEAEEYETLVELGVAWGQGYLFARPEPGFKSPTQVKSRNAK